jgi:hypothetical protein
LIAKAEVVDSDDRVVLDLDSTEIPVYGRQEQSAYNAPFESTCYSSAALVQPRRRMPGGETAAQQYLAQR